MQACTTAAAAEEAQELVPVNYLEEEEEVITKKQRCFPGDDGEMKIDDLNEEPCPFPVEEIVHYPLPGCAVPSVIGFSPDDRLVSYLFSPDRTLYRKVFTYDLATRRQELVFGAPDGGGLDESTLSAEEKLRRERTREMGLGVTRYEWRARCSCSSSSSYFPAKPTIMVPLPAGIYFQEVGGSEPELKLPSSPGSPIIDPHLSPDGNMLAYVKNDELHVLYLTDGETKQLTFGARGTGKTHGLAEYIAQEEMDRKTGFWWSPDSKYIAFTEVDLSDIPLYRIMHQGKNCVGSDAQEDHAYPFTGADNVKVRIGVLPADGGDVVWMDLLCGRRENNDEMEYLARVNWMHDNSLTVQVLNRSHTKLQILKFDIKTGHKKVLFIDEHEIWLTLHDCFTPLDKGMDKSSGGFIWASEKTGYRHLYLHDSDGNCLGPITQGDWMVEQIAGINENTGLVYFTGTMDGSLEVNLYCTNIFPNWNVPLKAPRRLTHANGRHTVILDHQMHRFIDVYDSLSSPPRILLCSLQDGSVITPVFEQPLSVPRFRTHHLVPPEVAEISAKDGTPLFGALYKPDPRRFGPPPYKTLIHVYGGPNLQLVVDSWINTVDMRAQYFRNKGILVWKLDNRGTPRRGLKFEGHLKHKMGQVDADDQLTGAEWLIEQGLAQAGHIGIHGWSYGGFLAAMCLARFPDTFRCAVSGAPVTSWDGYDTFYTEKYMGLPKENPDGYEYASIMHHVHKMKGKLLLVHGMLDENVHFRHTARLVNALISAGKPYELLIFPDERHLPRRLRDRVYIEERVGEFIERNL